MHLGLARGGTLGLFALLEGQRAAAVSAWGGSSDITGGAFGDTIEGSESNDTLRGADGDNRIVGGGGADLLLGGTGDDVLDGGAGNNRIAGGSGADTLLGGDGNDTVSDDWSPGDRSSVLDGGAGNDTLVSYYGGVKSISGDAGDDIISAGGGSDVMTGTIDGGVGDDQPWLPFRDFGTVTRWTAAVVPARCAEARTTTPMSSTTRATMRSSPMRPAMTPAAPTWCARPSPSRSASSSST